jgi:hypothetical protein
MMGIWSAAEVLLAGLPFAGWLPAVRLIPAKGKPANGPRLEPSRFAQVSALTLQTVTPIGIDHQVWHRFRIQGSTIVEKRKARPAREVLEGN